jgi:hypothetical protein
MQRKRVIPWLCALILCVPLFVSAQQPQQATRPLIDARSTGLEDAAKGTGLNQAKCSGEACVVNLAVAAVNVVFMIVGILLLLLFLYAGFLWMTAQGDTDRVKKAKETIMNAAFGLIIIVAAYSASVFVLDQLSSALSGKNSTSVPAGGQQNGAGFEGDPGFDQFNDDPGLFDPGSDPSSSGGSGLNNPGGNQPSGNTPNIAP